MSPGSRLATKWTEVVEQFRSSSGGLVRAGAMWQSRPESLWAPSSTPASQGKWTHVAKRTATPVLRDHLGNFPAGRWQEGGRFTPAAASPARREGRCVPTTMGRPQESSTAARRSTWLAWQRTRRTMPIPNTESCTMIVEFQFETNNFTRGCQLPGHPPAQGSWWAQRHSTKKERWPGWRWWGAWDTRNSRGGTSVSSVGG